MLRQEALSTGMDRIERGCREGGTGWRLVFVGGGSGGLGGLARIGGGGSVRVSESRTRLWRTEEAGFELERMGTVGRQRWRQDGWPISEGQQSISLVLLCVPARGFDLGAPCSSVE